MLRDVMSAERFAEGYRWEEYIETMQENRARIRRLYEVAKVPDDLREAMREAVARHGGQLFITALVEDYCPDVVANLPIVARLAEVVPGLELRIFVRSENHDIQAAYAAEGITRIPTFTLWTADFRPLGHLVERPAAGHAFVEAWEEAHEYARLRASDDPADRVRLQRLSLERMRAMFDWYQREGWRATLETLRQLATSSTETSQV